MNWEYITKHHSESLNELGGQGWELCAVENKYWYIFKRPMKCENCKFHKVEVDYDSFFGYACESEICSQHDIPCERDGCKKFKSKR